MLMLHALKINTGVTMKYGETFEADEREAIRESLIKSFDSLVHDSKDNLNTYRAESEAAINACTIVKACISDDNLPPESHQHFTDELKELFAYYTKRVNNQRENAGAAVGAIYETLIKLDQYAQHKNRFGDLKPLS